jgi:hypothetical protein
MNDDLPGLKALYQAAIRAALEASEIYKQKVPDGHAAMTEALNRGPCEIFVVVRVSPTRKAEFIIENAAGIRRVFASHDQESAPAVTLN